MLPFDDPNPRGELILGGINGSTAYGLATPNSDIDRIGVYAAPTSEFHGLDLPIGKKATWKDPETDYTLHEAAKMCHLLLSCNPTVTELLWLDAYEVKRYEGKMLIDIRRSFLSAKGVRNSYLGYATQQFTRLKNRGDGSFSSDTRKRTEKHARHLWRLIAQGTELHRTGRLTVKLTPDRAVVCREFGEQVADGDLNLAEDTIRLAVLFFDIPGMLPDAPDRNMAEQWLQYVRTADWTRVRVNDHLPELEPLAVRVLELGLGHLHGLQVVRALRHGPLDPGALSGVDGRARQLGFRLGFGLGQIVEHDGHVVRHVVLGLFKRHVANLVL